MMKRILFFAFSALFLGSGSMIEAQNVRIDVHVDAPVCKVVRPAWLGAAAWDAPYVYIPELDLYYSMAEGFYYYFDGRQWCCSMSLPVCFRAYDLSALRHIAIRTRMPWRYNREHRARYCRAGQMRLLQRRDAKIPARLPDAPKAMPPKRDGQFAENRPGVGQKPTPVRTENRKRIERNNAEGRDVSAKRFVKKGLRRVSSDVDAERRTASPLRTL
ncbi:MAG: hypothetical protein ACOYJE_05865 [Bacteroidaceae bacterium]|jgi:hypothetical protein